MVVVIALMALATFVSPASQAETVNSTNTNTGSGTTVTCTLYGVIKYDVIFLEVTGTQTVSTVADTSADTFNSQVSQTAAASTVKSNSYLYSATVGASTGTEVITVTFSSSAQSFAYCLDTAGWSATKTASSTGSGTSSGTGYSSTVGSYTPAAGSFELSIAGGGSCGVVTSTSFPASPTGTGKGSITTATSCKASPSTNFFYAGAASYFQSHSGAASTDPYTVAGSQTIGSNSADVTEVAAYFPANAVNAKSVTEVNSLTVAEATATTTIDKQTIALTQIAQTAQRVNTEGVGLFAKNALTPPSNSEQVCLGVKVNLTNGVYIVNTGPVCGVASVVAVGTVVACNFFQLQCWAIPLMYMGMIEGFFIGVASLFRVSEKSFGYLMLAGLMWGSLVDVALGIMTPTVPVILIALTLAYSFRLDKLVRSAV